MKAALMAADWDVSWAEKRAFSMVDLLVVSMASWWAARRAAQWAAMSADE